MNMPRWSSGGFFLTLALVVSSLPYDDFSDLRGKPYCEERGCCQHRQDSCSVPILGTLCYCDQFCNKTQVEDCCPDYWSVCLGIAPPPTLPPLPPPSTTRRPEEIRTCRHNGQALMWRQKVQENCNVCECVDLGGQLGMVCQENVCLVDPNIIETVNEETQYGWRAANYSEFWGRTLDDGVLLRLGTLKPQQIVMKMNPMKKIYDPNALPREFNAESKWPRYISGIQDQGWCGSSWAVSTAAVASDRYAIISKGYEEVQLSAQNLISCAINGQKSCEGGRLDRAWSFVRKNGLVDEECFPYIGMNKKCTIKSRGRLMDSGCRPPRYGDRKDRYKVGPAYRLGNETDIMFEIINSGPVQATMKVYHDFFSYRQGIYRHTDLTLNQKQGYHSVRIVGWGEENTYRGPEKYWKVANSWGPNWGEDGYFRIAKGRNECEIESFVLGTWPEVDHKLLVSSQLNEI